MFLQFQRNSLFSWDKCGCVWLAMSVGDFVPSSLWTLVRQRKWQVYTTLWGMKGIHRERTKEILHVNVLAPFWDKIKEEENVWVSPWRDVFLETGSCPKSPRCHSFLSCCQRGRPVRMTLWTSYWLSPSLWPSCTFFYSNLNAENSVSNTLFKILLVGLFLQKIEVTKAHASISTSKP